MATKDSTLTQEYLHSLFYYKDGNLYWKKSSKGTKKDAKCGWVSKTCVQFELNQKNYKLHRLIFLFHYGYIPQIIDHIDGNPHNNKIENLREATQSQNMMNSKIRKNNTSGYKGITFHKKMKKWLAQADFNKKHYYLGLYNTKEEAHAVAKEFRLKNFGEYYREN